MKAGLWKTDWFLGAVVVLVVLVFNRSSDLIPSLEQKAYDLGMQSTSRLPSDKVAVIAIDDTSIANIGRWPWSREIHAPMTLVFATTVFFSEPQIDRSEERRGGKDGRRGVAENQAQTKQE